MRPNRTALEGAECKWQRFETSDGRRLVTPAACSGRHRHRQKLMLLQVVGTSPVRGCAMQHPCPTTGAQGMNECILRPDCTNRRRQHNTRRAAAPPTSLDMVVKPTMSAKRIVTLSCHSAYDCRRGPSADARDSSATRTPWDVILPSDRCTLPRRTAASGPPSGDAGTPLSSVNADMLGDFGNWPAAARARPG